MGISTPSGLHRRFLPWVHQVQDGVVALAATVTRPTAIVLYHVVQLGYNLEQLRCQLAVGSRWKRPAIDLNVL